MSADQVLALANLAEQLVGVAVNITGQIQGYLKEHDAQSDRADLVAVRAKDAAKAAHAHSKKLSKG